MQRKTILHCDSALWHMRPNESANMSAIDLIIKNHGMDAVGPSGTGVEFAKALEEKGLRWTALLSSHRRTAT